MKVDGPGKVEATGTKSTKKKRAAGVKFQVTRPAAEPSAPSLSGLGPVAAVDALLSAQEVGSETGRRQSRGYRIGEEMLDFLQSVQNGLLAGGTPVSHLKRLRKLVLANRDSDPVSELKRILAEIEIRVEVELAKLNLGA